MATDKPIGWPAAKQSDDPWEPQPDAFSGLGGGGVFGAPSGSDSGGLSDDSPTQGSGNGWGDLQQDSQPAGLDTVRRCLPTCLLLAYCLSQPHVVALQGALMPGC